jgi:hypothetical protein
MARSHVETGRRDVNFGFAAHDQSSAATARWTNRANALPLRLFTSLFLACLLGSDLVPSCLDRFSRNLFPPFSGQSLSANLPPF